MLDQIISQLRENITNSSGNVPLWLFAACLVLAIGFAWLGIKLISQPSQPKPRILEVWPKPRNPVSDTADVTPPSQRRSSELKPPNVIASSSGGLTTDRQFFIE